MLRALLWLSLLVACIFAVLIPATYLYISASLPQLDTEFDLLRVLRLPIESERRSVAMNHYDKTTEPVTFERPDIVNFPKELVALYITERGCPTYFQSPREEGLAWGKRMFGAVFGMEFDGDGWCEKLFAEILARKVAKNVSDSPSRLQILVAAHKIHRFMKKDGLVAYDLATTATEPGIIGVEAVAKLLFQKKLADMSLAELAEFQLAFPPHGFYNQIKLCGNPILIRQNRDVLLERLAMIGMVAMDKAKLAVQTQLACPSVKR